MRARRVSIVLLIATACLFLGWSTDPNTKANQLFVESAQLLYSVKTNGENYSKAYKSYKKAQIDLETIFSKYASSNVAVGLMSGQIKIAGCSYDRFQALDEPLRSLA